MTECPRCGASVAEGEARCGECGRRLHAVAASTASTSIAVPSPLPPLPPPPRRSRRFGDVVEPPRVVETTPAPAEGAEAEPPPATEPTEDDAWRPLGATRRAGVTTPPPPAEPAPPAGATMASSAVAPAPGAGAAAPTTAPSGDEFVWPPPWMPPEEATPLQRSKRLRVAVGAGAVLVVALLGAFIASRVADDADDAGEIKPTELQVGQCFNAPREELVSVELRPCTEDHQHEVFAVVDHPASRSARYPGDDEILRFAGERCIPLFERYGNVPYEQANLADFEVVPTRESWESGERRVICAVSSLDGEPMRGSVRGQRRP